MEDLSKIKCTYCDRLCKHAQTNCLLGEGPESTDIVFVGEAPGKVEDELRRPFVGRAGKFLRKHIFLPVGIDERSVYLTNCVKCRPPENKTPTLSEIRNCRTYLEEELKRLKPKVVVALGNAALSSILYEDSVSGVTRWRGKPLWNREFNCWVIITYHPSKLMRDRGMGTFFSYEQALSDVELAIQYITKPKPIFNTPIGQIIESQEDAIKYFNRMFLFNSQIEKISLDLETDLFHPENDILGVSICYKIDDSYFAAYIKWEAFSGEADSLFKRLLLNENIIKIGHNISFDEKFLYYHGYKIKGKIYDTMIGVHLLDENFFIGLKENTWRYLDFGGYENDLLRWKINNKFRKTSSYKLIPFDILSKYSLLDSVATYRLFEKIVPKLGEENLFPLYNKILMPARKVLLGIEIYGFQVDLDMVKIMEDRFNNAKEIIVKKIYDFVKHEFKILSTKELAVVLYDELKLPVLEKTKTGKRSVDSNVLTKLSKLNKKGSVVVKYLLDYKKIDKMLGTYVLSIKNRVWRDEKIHMSFNEAGTVTGRLSSSTHNIPKDKLIRSLYKASPGRVLLEADLKAAELRVLAAYSKEPVFINAFSKGLDIHDVVYRWIFKKSSDYIPNQDERRVAKTINFGTVYGISSSGLSNKIGISIEEAEKFLSLYFERLPKIKMFMVDTIKLTKQREYVQSVFYRRRRLPEIKSDDRKEFGRCARQAINAPIQSTASDYTLFSLVRLQKLLKDNNCKSSIVQTVHDCVVVDTLIEEKELVRQLIKKAFESKINVLPIQMEVDVVESVFWGEHNESSLDDLLKSLGV